MSIGDEINCCSEDLGIEKGMSYRELRDIILNRLLEYDKHIDRPRDVENAVLNSIDSVYHEKGLNKALILIAFALYGVDLKDTHYAKFYRLDKDVEKLEAGEYDDQLTEEDKRFIKEDMEEIKRRAGKFKVKPRSYKKGSYNYLGIRNGQSYRGYVNGIIDDLKEYLDIESTPWQAIAACFEYTESITEENGLNLAFSEIAKMLFEMEVGEVDKAVAVPACTALSEMESGEYDFLLTQEDIEEMHKDGEKIKRYCKEHDILNLEEFNFKLD